MYSFILKTNAYETHRGEGPLLQKKLKTKFIYNIDGYFKNFKT